MKNNRLQHQLDKHVDKSKVQVFTNEAMLAKDKAMHHLSKIEMISINKLNRADTKSQFAQTIMCDINNLIICQRPSEINKPLKPCNIENSLFI